MRSSETRIDAAEIAVLVLLGVGNLLFLALMGLPCEPDPHMGLRRTASFEIVGDQIVGDHVAAIIQDSGYTDWFSRSVRRNNLVFMLGTSESDKFDNLACEINGLRPPLRWESIARGGLSPIHAAIFFARTIHSKIRLPPAVYVVNPVYFGRSHNRVDDGWLSFVASAPASVAYDCPPFEDLLQSRTTEALQEHLRPYRRLLPFTFQAHLAHRLYLWANRSPVTLEVPEDEPGECVSRTATSRYDATRNVHSDYQPRDWFVKSHWQMMPPEESVNLRGVTSIIEMWRQTNAPLLLLVLPPNRAFYASQGIDMEKYDRFLLEHRRVIQRTVASQTGERLVYFVDFNDDFVMEQGYGDRMHPDGYGNWQMAEYLVAQPGYRSFMKAAMRYYKYRPNAHVDQDADSKPAH